MQVVATLHAKANCGERPEISPAGDRVTIANSDGLQVFELETWERVGHVPGSTLMCTHSWSPDGNRIATDRSLLQVIDVESLEIVAKIKLPNLLHGIAWSSPEEVVAVDRRGSIHICHIPSGRIVRSISQAPSCRDADFRGATGLSEDVAKTLKDGGAKV